MPSLAAAVEIDAKQAAGAPPSMPLDAYAGTWRDPWYGDIVIAPNDSALAQAAGIPNLVEEQSTSATLGLTWTPRDNLSLTLDAYRIEIDDRVVLSGEFDNTDPNIGGALDDLGVGLARFFFNSVDTRTTGVDLTVSHDMALGGGMLASFLGLNYGKTEITQVHTPPELAGREDTLLNERERWHRRTRRPDFRWPTPAAPSCPRANSTFCFRVSG